MSAESASNILYRVVQVIVFASLYTINVCDLMFYFVVISDDYVAISRQSL